MFVFALLFFAFFESATSSTVSVCAVGLMYSQLVDVCAPVYAVEVCSGACSAALYIIKLYFACS
jgi:hypothetical protein